MAGDWKQKATSQIIAVKPRENQHLSPNFYSVLVVEKKKGKNLYLDYCPGFSRSILSVTVAVVQQASSEDIFLFLSVAVIRVGAFSG